MTDEDPGLAWRKLITDWHLKAGMPGCGCDDDTGDDKFCADSVAYADRLLGERPDPVPDGAPDKWQHDLWVAAWGRNMPLIVDDLDYRLPRPPDGLRWLGTRMLVGGQRLIELALLRFDEHKVVVLSRDRAVAEPGLVLDRARQILQRPTE